MTNNKNKVGVGAPMATGGVRVAPDGTPVPTSATTALAATFANVGYISEEGLINTIESETETIRSWEGDEVLPIKSSRSETFTFTGIETNETMLKLAYGDANVGTSEDGIAVIHNSKDMPYKVIVIEIALTESLKKRIVIPQGKVTALGEVTYTGNTAVGYPVTISALPDASGNTAYEYIAEV